jgi:murein DD-endopeptidase
MYNNETQITQRVFDLRKVLVCILILSVLVFFKKFDTPLSNPVITKIDYFVLEYTYDFNDLVTTVQNITEKTKAIPVLNLFEVNTMIMPVEGETSSGYGMRVHPVLKVERMHNGIDIIQSEGTPVKAVLEGIVTYTGEDREMGRFIKISHPDNLVTIYAHLKEIQVTKDDKVEQGQIIGTIGTTGLAESPHLHFEVWENNIPQDPLKWLKQP